MGNIFTVCEHIDLNVTWQSWFQETNIYRVFVLWIYKVSTGKEEMEL